MIQKTKSKYRLPIEKMPLFCESMHSMNQALKTEKVIEKLTFKETEYYIQCKNTGHLIFALPEENFPPVTTITPKLALKFKEKDVDAIINTLYLPENYCKIKVC